jgi:hypothetical protein
MDEGMLDGVYAMTLNLITGGSCSIGIGNSKWKSLRQVRIQVQREML